MNKDILNYILKGFIKFFNSSWCVLLFWFNSEFIRGS